MPTAPAGQYAVTQVEAAFLLTMGVPPLMRLSCTLDTAG